MNKALEILKQVKELSGWIKCGAELSFDEELDEAIEEIQEAMKPKTCYGCSNLFFDEIEKVYKCSNDVSDDVGYLHGEAVIRNIKDFHCVQHQPKDNA